MKKLILILCILMQGCFYKLYSDKEIFIKLRKIYPYKTIWKANPYYVIKIHENDFIHAYQGFFGMEYSPLIKIDKN